MGKTVGRKVLRLLILFILLCLLGFAAALGVLEIMQHAVPPATAQTDAIIVLGCQVKPDGTLSVQLEYRLNAALSAYQEKPRPIIVCGAQGTNEPAPEGAVMRDWLIAKGVPAESVTAETSSYDTLQNIRNAAALLPEGARRVTIITSDYHLPRAIRIARDQGLAPEGIGSPCKPEYWFKNHSREVLAWGKYLLYRILPLG